MKSGSVPTRMTRIQVQEKFKKNFQALCAKCPQLAKNHDSLDDSLTSLQWLWNLNVNISNPTDQIIKGGPMQRSSNLLPPFPRNLFNRLDSDAAAASLLSGQSQELSATAKSNPGEKNCKIQSVQPSNSAKTTAHVGTGNLRRIPKSGRKNSGQVLGKSSSPSSQSEGLTRYSSANSLRKLKRGLFQANSVDAVHSASSTDSIPAAKPDGISHLPRITASNMSESEPVLSDVSSPRNYSFSPRETMLDLLPGQVDYKNNPYVKPTFSFTSLICMAIQSSKNRRLTLSGVCKWITDNFMYYRYADSGWQNSIKLNLTQSKYFSKFNKKRDSANCLWGINRDCDLQHGDVASSLTNGSLPDVSPRLLDVDNNNFSSNSSTIPLLSSMTKDTDNDDNLLLAGRKRKQTSPQKLVRRRNAAAKKRRNVSKVAGNQNLLQEEAPELGSLKGDFNWNTIFDEFFGANDAELSFTPTSLPSRPQTQEGNGATGRFSDDVVSGSLLAHDLLVLPDIPVAICEKSVISSDGVKRASSKWQSPNDCNLHPTNEDLLVHDISSALASDYRFSDANVDDPGVNHINEFMKEVELDLTVTGKRVGPPTSWIPECSELEELLRQNNDIGVGLEGIPPEEEIERLFLTSTSLETTNNNGISHNKAVLICPTNSPAEELKTSI